MSTVIRAAAIASRAWVKLYTARLPEELRSSRRAEMDADLWEHEQDRLASHAPPAAIAVEMVLRTCLGAVDDIAWRFEVVRALRGSTNKGGFKMNGFTSRQTSWMGLAGVAGGVLWAINLLSLTLRDRSQFPSVWDRVVPIVIGALLLAGLVGFLSSYRQRLGRKGTIGALLLVTAVSSYLLANSLLPLVPAGAIRNGLGAAFALGFAIVPIPAFILLGLTFKGPARVGAFLVAVVGPLGMLLPMILASVGIVNPQWIRADSPVSLTWFLYFVLAAAWLAAAGYQTWRHAQRPV